jgi:undecaprenyl-diphosphatase
MTILASLVLGIVQGITEFLPVSSSAHLILIRWISGWQDLGLSFDIALHFGTLLSLLLYFGKDWCDLLRGFAASLRERSLSGDPLRRMSWLLVGGSLPAAIMGLLAEDWIERHFRNPLSIAIMMILFGTLLIYADKRGKLQKGLEEVGLIEALGIGVAQAFALLPGVSRSGITITAGLLLGLKRETAARFSFLLASPIVAGAALLQGLHLLKVGLPNPERLPFLLGTLSAALFGFLSIRYLLRYLGQGRLAPFGYYRWAVGIAILVLSWSGGGGR